MCIGVTLIRLEGIMEEEGSARKEIRQLLAVLLSGVGLAVVASLFMIFFYGPSGQYAVKNVLLSPELLGKLEFTEGGIRVSLPSTESSSVILMMGIKSGKLFPLINPNTNKFFLF